MKPDASLPQPAPDAIRHSLRLIDAIRTQIADNGGWISFARYMELALYAPGLGYYTAGAHKFGEAGDFVTAPEISALFGRTLARQVREIMDCSSPYVLELGAGSGKLAVDMLTEFERQDCLPHAYFILEVSADLRARQQALLQQRLPNLADRVHWLDALPEEFSGAIVANEVLDALPVHRVRWQDGLIDELGVAWAESGFVWEARPIVDAALLQAAERISVPDGYVSEICVAATGLLSSLACRLTRGALLFIDYGFGAREFYHPQRSSGTLMCHYRHRAHDDPFYLPGLQDITAHVDFTAVAESGIDAGLELLGYTSQAFFLIGNGITELLQEADPENLRDYLPLSSELQKLTSPAEMGELFKVIGLGRGIERPLSGFTHGALLRTL